MLVMAATLVASAPAAQAQSSTDLQAQISALLAQIAQLQAQLGTGTGTSTATCAITFARNLTTGSVGTDVKALQQFLNAKGYMVAASGAGSMGMETMTFGSLTTKALAKFQAANAISPAVGYFGPITRAKVNSMCTPSTGGGNTGGGNPVPGAGLSVSLSSMNPSSGSLISSSGSAAARVPVLAVNFTAGAASGVTVSDIAFMKNGVLSDSAVAGAYLVENGKVVAQYNSVSNGKIFFTNLGWNIAAGQTRTVWLAIDPAAGLNPGNSVSFSLASASDVKAWDSNNAAVTVAGSFPMMGNLFTVTTVSNPSLATMTVASSSIGGEVTAGTNNNIVGAFTLTVSNSKVWLKGINFRVIGSANKNDIRNVQLWVNNVQVGNVLPSVAADGTAYFDLSSSPATLNTGSNLLQVRADITGSPSYNFQFEILNSYDIYAVDSQYNVPITAQSNIGSPVTIKTGSITVSKATDSPTGNITVGSGLTIAKFSVYAGGEGLQIKWLGFGLNLTGGTGSIDDQFRNVSLVDDMGNQVGSTINNLSTAVTCTDTLATTTLAAVRNCFGSSGSPINYTVPANTTRVLSLKADIPSTANFTSVTGLLTGNTSNARGVVSSQTVSTAGVTGNARNFSSSALAVVKNSAVGNQTVTPNSSVKIGSYVLTASSADGVTVSSLNILMGANATSTQNVMVQVNGTQFGSTLAIPVASTVYSFSGSPFMVPAGQSVTVDVWATISSQASAGTYTAITTLSGCSASSQNSGSNITCSSTAGQNVVVAGQATLQVSADSSLTAKHVVMGQTSQTLAAFRLTETTNIEDVNITELNIVDQVASTTTVQPSFANLHLFVNGVDVAGQGSFSVSASTTPSSAYLYKFNTNAGTPIMVAKGGAATIVTLKGDVNTYGASGATDVSTHIFKIATTTDADVDTAIEVVDARGASSQASSTISFSSPTANTLTVLRGKLTLSSTVNGGTSHTRQAVDDVANITFSSVSGGSEVKLNTITITISGGANSSTLPGSVTLVNPDGTTFANATIAAGATSTTSVTFNVSGSEAVIPVTGKTVKLRINSNNTTDVAQNTETLSFTINASTDVVYTTAEVSGTAVTLDPSLGFPMVLSTVTY